MMFRLAYLIVFLLILGLQSLCTQTTHIINGGTHVFKYNWVPWFFMGLITLTHIAFAEIARRFLRDRFIAITCLLGIPLFFFISLQFVCERVEVTEQLLIHRREPPHTEYNADIVWDDIRSATRIKREKPGLFGPNFFNVGYELKMDDGTTHLLPSNTVLTAAHEIIDRVLDDHGVPIETREVLMAKE